MDFSNLINASKTHFTQYPGAIQKRYSLHFFQEGGMWMKERLTELNPSSHKENSEPLFALYGYIKYSMCILFATVIFVGLYRVHPMLSPFSIIGFYLMEVHFVFLFPLLADHSEQPLLQSIRKTYQIGLLKVVPLVMLIAGYMVVGLLKKQPLFNWHIGCMAILIWYNNETGNR